MVTKEEFYSEIINKESATHLSPNAFVYNPVIVNKSSQKRLEYIEECNKLMNEVVQNKLIDIYTERYRTTFLK